MNDADRILRGLDVAISDIRVQGDAPGCGDVAGRRAQRRPGTNWYWPDNGGGAGRVADPRRIPAAVPRPIAHGARGDRGPRARLEGPATGFGGERVARGQY